MPKLSKRQFGHSPCFLLCAGKQQGDQLFETFDAQDLNKELKNIMDGLSVKVFRTYNASIVLDRLLSEWEATKKGHSTAQTVDQKKVDYDIANKEVRWACAKPCDCAVSWWGFVSGVSCRSPDCWHVAVH